MCARRLNQKFDCTIGYIQSTQCLWTCGCWDQFFTGSKAYTAFARPPKLKGFGDPLDPAACQIVRWGSGYSKFPPSVGDRTLLQLPPSCNDVMTMLAACCRSRGSLIQKLRLGILRATSLTSKTLKPLRQSFLQEAKCQALVEKAMS